MEYHPPASESDAHGLDDGTNHTIVHSPSTTEASVTVEAAGKGRTECPRSPERHPTAGPKAGPLPAPRPLPCSRIKTPSFPAGCRWSSGSSRPLPSPGSPASVSHHILTVSDPAVSPNRRSVVPRRHSLISHHVAPRGKVTSPPRAVGATARAPPASSHSLRTKDGVSLSNQLTNASFRDGAQSAVLDRRGGVSESPCATRSSANRTLAGKLTGPGDTRPASVPVSGSPSPDPCPVQRNGLEREALACRTPRGEEEEEEEGDADGEIGRSHGSKKTGAGPVTAPRQPPQSPLKPKIVETYGQFGIRRMEASELGGRPATLRRPAGKEPLEIPCPLSAAQLLAPSFAAESPEGGRGDAGEEPSLLDDGDHPFDSIDIDIVSVLNSPNLLGCGTAGEAILTESYQDQTLHYGAQIIVGDQREPGAAPCKGKYPGAVELLSATAAEGEDGANTSDDDLDNYYNFARTVVTEEVMDQLASECFGLDGEVPRIDQLDGVDDSAHRPPGHQPAQDGGQPGTGGHKEAEGEAAGSGGPAGDPPLPSPGKGGPEPEGGAAAEELGNILPSEIMDFVLKNSSGISPVGEGAALQLSSPPEARTTFTVSLPPSSQLGALHAKEMEVDQPPAAAEDPRRTPPPAEQSNHLSTPEKSPPLTLTPAGGRVTPPEPEPVADGGEPAPRPVQDPPEERPPRPPEGDPHFPEPPQIQRVCANLAGEAAELGAERRSPGEDPAPKNVILVNKHGQHMVILKSVQDGQAEVGRAKGAPAPGRSLAKSASPPGQGPTPTPLPVRIGKAPAGTAAKSAPVPERPAQSLKTPLKLVAPKFPSDVLSSARVPPALEQALPSIIQLSKPEVVYINQPPPQQNYGTVLVRAPGPVALLRPPPEVTSLALGPSLLNVVSVQPAATATGQLLAQDCRGAVGNLVFARREPQVTCIVPISQGATPGLVPGTQKVQVVPTPAVGPGSQQSASSKPLDAEKVGSANAKTPSMAGGPRNSWQGTAPPSDPSPTPLTSGLKHASLTADRAQVKKQKTSHIWVDQYGTERKVLEDLPKIQPPTSLGNGRVRIKTPTIKASVDLDQMEHLNSENTKSEQVDNPSSRVIGISLRDSTLRQSERRAARDWKQCSGELSSEDESMASTPREEEEEEEEEEEDDDEDDEEEEEVDEKDKENWRGQRQ
ncbi:uncharacterized protein LOC144489541 [Mustelus asterias]